MSHFLRQFHIISSLKTNSERELLPFYKVIAPVLARYPPIRKMQTQSISNHMKLKTTDSKDGEKKRKLAVILSWMLAKESHVDKFRAIYLSRGFDVLTVDMVPKDLLFPTSGSQVVATNLLDYMVKNEHYDKILIHAFSVGGYLMGEMFVKMRDNADKYMGITNRIHGVVLDSAVDFEGIPTGFPRAVSSNPITIKMLEWYTNAHLALMYQIATKHYLKSSKNFHNTPLRCPTLCFVSEADKVGTPNSNKMVLENWEIRGVDCKLKSFKDSKHVSHLYKYENEYMKEIDDFLKKVDLIPSKL
ncbi:uncharacterized protein [Parasteatoda tepidariorum]|uniref:uncharacterized protein isoform X1 n=1 Tax=Parasteatoda tepidariorum TaxID=114398 RepID=UPI00077FC97E|nr:transmembrane protein 53 isoform X2 [Parasteatoda tepidariorum]